MVKALSEKPNINNPSNEENCSNNPDEIEVLQQKCDNCKFVTNDVDSLQEHVKRVHNYKCRMCGNICPSQNKFKEHMKEHKKELDQIKYICNICKKLFNSQAELKAHKQKPCKTPVHGLQPNNINRFGNKKLSNLSNDSVL